jgi:branched-chain amino acid transport system ATP-binding protein
MTAVLTLAALSRCYGAIAAVDEVSFVVRSGARHAVIGPNGAGKSTLFQLVSGALRPSGGSIGYNGAEITGTDQVWRARHGIQQTFQHSSLFPSMTVAENLALAIQRREGVGHHWWRRASRMSALGRSATEVLERVGLAERAGHLVSALSHGERRQLEVGVALAGRPRLLLLDEPTAGMSPAETARFVDLVAALPEETTVLIVEHDLDVVFRLATEITVLNLGRVLATGTPEAIAADERVQAVYLSGDHREDLFATTEPGGAAE